VDITLTIIGQSVAFFVFWWFCAKYVWPLFMNIMEERRQKIADGLEAAASAIAIAGAEKILEGSIDQAANEDMLNKLASEL